MAAINHSDLFDLEGFNKGLKEAKANVADFAGSVEAVLARVGKEQKEVLEALRGYAKLVKEMNAGAPGTRSRATGMAKEIDETIVKSKELKAVAAGLAQIMDLNSASVRELEAEYRGLRTQLKALKPDAANFEQEAAAIRKRMGEAKQGVDAFNASLKATKQTVDYAEGSYRKMSLELANLKKALQSIPGAFDPVTGKLNQNNKQAVALAAEITRLDGVLKAADASMGVFTRNVGNYQSAFGGLKNSFSQLAREAPAFAMNMQTGFLAISNNLPIFFDAIGQTRKEIAALKAEGQQAPSLFKAIGASIFSMQTLLMVGVTALTIFGDEIVGFIDGLFKTKKSIDGVKESQRLLNDALKSTEYAGATQAVDSLRINVDLARRGLIDKKDVVDQYNEGIGQTIGQVSTLDQVEQALVKNGEAYIQMMLYKAAATAALEESAKKALEAEQNRLKKEKEFAKGTDAVAYTTLTSAPGALPAGLIQQSQQTGEAARKAAQKRRKDEAVKEAQNASDVLRGIAAKFQKDAATISAEYKFDFYGNLTKDGKDGQKEAKDAAKEAEERLRRQIEAIRKQQELIKSGAELDVKTQELALVNKEISEREYQERRYEIQRAYILKVIELEQSLGKNSDSKRIADFRKELQDSEVEYTKFIQKIREGQGDGTLAQRSTARVTGTLDRTPSQDSQLDTLGAKAFDAEMKRFALLKAGREISFAEEIDHLEKLKAARIGNAEETARLQQDIDQRKAERKKSLELETEQFIQDAVLTGISIVQDITNAKYEERMMQLNQEKQRELELAGNNNAARARIEADYQKKANAEKAKKAKKDKEFALYEVAVNTAIAIGKTVAEWGMPFAIPFIALAAGQGLLQAAMIAARPIPKFFKGTASAPEGPAWVGEQGSELVERNGKLYVTPNRPTLTYLEGGERIHTAPETRRMLESMERADLLRRGTADSVLSQDLRGFSQQQAVYTQAMAMQLSGGITKETMREAFTEALAELPIEKHIWDERGYRRSQQTKNSITTYLNEKNSFS